MADHEMIAATLAAGILSAADFGGSKMDPAEHAVVLYRQVLAALASKGRAPSVSDHSAEGLIETSTRRRQI